MRLRFFFRFCLPIGVLILETSCSSARFSPNRPVSNRKMGLFDRWAKSPTPTQPSRPIPSSQSVVVRQAAPELSARSLGLGFSWPLKQVEITSHFGKRGRDFHEGIDLRAQTGTPVFAAKGGVVLYAASRIRGYGNMIVIRHLGKFNTIYAHNSKILVERGQRVKQDQQIAISGATGHVTGPHLHFEIRKGIAAVNPVGFLPKPERKLSFFPLRKRGLRQKG